jgi:hypothetical protein
MTRTKLAVLIILIVLFVGVPVFGQEANVNDQWQALNKALDHSYSAKDWTGALSTLDEMMKLADSTNNVDARGSIYYMRGCVQALAGHKAQALEAIRQALAAGFTDYSQYSGDPDLDALRQDAEFKTLLAEIKAKYGPVPLAWDRSQPAPEFNVSYDDPADPRFLEMRREFAIDDVVAGTADDIERLSRLAHWVSVQWEHSSDQMASKSDPVTILREAHQGGRFICREYAIVMEGVAAAYGYPARLVNLLPRDVETRSEAHSVAEVWLEKRHKWVLVDGQWGCLATLDGLPLSALELQAALAADKPVVCSAGAAVMAEWKPFILRNAFYIKTGDNQRAFDHGTKSQLVLVPAGAPKPTKFAGGNEQVFAGAIYTSNPDSFYAPPRR